MSVSPSLGERAPLAEGDLQLPRPPGVIRRFWARHPWWTDSLVAGIYFLLAGLGVLVVVTAPAIVPDPQPQPVELVALRMLATAFMAAALLFRRYRPWTVLALTWVGTLVGTPFEGAPDGAAIPLALYALAVYRSARDAWIGLAGSVMVGAVTAYLSVAVNPSDPIDPGVLATSVQLAVTMLLATLIGTNIGNRKRYVAALVDRANQLARERDQQAQLATAEERSRIAREMHDIVSHSLTVMVTLADGSAAATTTSPDRAVEAMRQVAETGRHALADMRRMLGVLHTGEDPSAPGVGLEPQPGSAEIAGLVETFRAASLPVTYSSTGSPPEDPGEQLAIYRIVQEALTNVLRHAAGVTRATVEVRYGPPQTVVTVTDDGHGVGEAGAGHGLLGMRERVALYGGTLESGPRTRGGWSVRATLPSGGGR